MRREHHRRLDHCITQFPDKLTCKKEVHRLLDEILKFRIFPSALFHVNKNLQIKIKNKK